MSLVVQIPQSTQWAHNACGVEASVDVEVALAASCADESLSVTVFLKVAPAVAPMTASPAADLALSCTTVPASELLDVASHLSYQSARGVEASVDAGSDIEQVPVQAALVPNAALTKRLGLA
jgi:hypothetical protein